MVNNWFFVLWFVLAINFSMALWYVLSVVSDRLSEHVRYIRMCRKKKKGQAFLFAIKK